MYGSIQSGELDFARYFEQVVARAAGLVARLLDRFGLGDTGRAAED